MTVDEMVQWMGYVKKGSTIPIQRCDNIIAALRAGQELSALVLQGAIIGARGERDLFAAACKFKDAATGENK